MDDAAERVLAPLVGLPMWGAVRQRDVLVVQFGGRRRVEGGENPGDAGQYALYVYCAWRLSDATGIVAGNGDIFTPADPDADLEYFEWEAQGSTWLDVRLREFAERHAAQAPVVNTFVTDALAGFRLVLTEGVELDVLPNSSPSAHVETDFWRLIRPGEVDAQIVASTSGIAMVEPERE